MLIERGIQVMNFEVVGDAYAIASNYLRKTGAIAEHEVLRPHAQDHATTAVGRERRRVRQPDREPQAFCLD